jgi:hypothetical protein
LIFKPLHGRYKGVTGALQIPKSCKQRSGAEELKPLIFANKSSCDGVLRAIIEIPCTASQDMLSFALTPGLSGTDTRNHGRFVLD